MTKAWTSVAAARAVMTAATIAGRLLVRPKLVIVVGARAGRSCSGATESRIVASAFGVSVCCASVNRTMFGLASGSSSRSASNVICVPSSRCPVASPPSGKIARPTTRLRSVLSRRDDDLVADVRTNLVERAAPEENLVVAAGRVATDEVGMDASMHVVERDTLDGPAGDVELDPRALSDGRDSPDSRPARSR